jgi:Carboxypeptidase regulatory-like domain
MSNRTSQTWVTISLLLLFAPRAGAQVGVTTDILTGSVTDSAGAPVPDAVVEAVSQETGISRAARTDARGRYRILFPDGGGRYQLFVRAIGKAPVRRVAERQGDDDRLVTDIRLTAARPAELAELVVRARAPVRPGSPATPGSIEAVLTPDRLARLPIDAGDLTAIATLAPGIVGLDGTDSTDAAFSAAGQRPSANTTTLDGLTFAAQNIPQDAVRATRVITNTYDVSRGQFSGALVASTTRSGTSAFQATLNGSLRDPTLAVGSDSLTALPAAQQQLSFGTGGPLLANRLFGFGAGQVRHRSARFVSLEQLDGGGAERLGLAADSLARFRSILAALAVPVAASGLPDDRLSMDWSGIGRLDLLLGTRHTLTLRGDGRWNSSEPARISPFSYASSGGETVSSGGGGLLQLSSQVGQSLLNEAKVYLSGSRTKGDPYLGLPQGRVQVSSTLPDGRTGLTTLVFGGSPGFPQHSRTTSLEATDELSWISGDGAHRVKLGAFYTTASTTQEVAADLLGSFSYQSLTDLEAGKPALFTRALEQTERRGRSSTAALYLGDTWRASASLQLTYGIRGERSWFGGAPPYNAAADSAFGLRTDRLPGESHLSPRAGFTWVDRRPDGPAPWTIRGGIGEFRSPVPAGLAVQAQNATGRAAAVTQLYCTGPEAPTPDWQAIAQDVNAIPSACASGLGTQPTAAPSITAFAPGFTAPRVWRGSIGLQRRRGLFTLGLDLSAAVGVSQWGFVDRNLGPARFTLGNEGGREVYTVPGAIDSATGLAPLASSRLDPAFGQVFAIASDLTTRSAQVVLSATGILGRGVVLGGSYTLSRSTDQSSAAGFGGGGGLAGQTAGISARQGPRSASDFDRRHQFLITLTVPVARGLEVTTIGRGLSGAPYTPTVAGDLNADGSRNDRAFVFDPDGVIDPALGQQLQRLLVSGPGRVRSCLQSQLGHIAGRNSCRGPWTTSLDLQLNWRPTFLGLDQRLTVSMVTSNLLGGLDQLFHGDDLHGWGQSYRPDPTLLTVRGFDSVARQFRYDVNQRFGDVRTSRAVRQPFQLGIQLRLSLGGQPGFGGGLGARGGVGRGGGPGGFGGAGGVGPGRERLGGGRPGPGDRPDSAPGADSTNRFGDRLARILPNPVDRVLEYGFQLKLSEDQTARLDEASRRFAQQRDSLARDMQAEIQRAGQRPDPAVIISTLRGRLRAGRELAAGALDQARAVLTPEQWSDLPEDAKKLPEVGGLQRRPR